MFLPVLLFFLIFRYVPMAGLVIAFKDYNMFDGIFASSWVGLKNFQLIFDNPQTASIIRNTLLLSSLNLLVGFPFPILIALMLNEARKAWIKKPVQTLIFLPHMLNWVIVGGIVINVFATEHGVINNLLEQWFGFRIPFLFEEKSWLLVYALSNVWKEAGFGAIIYLAALSSIDPSLYESAAMDGASKWRQIWHISLPGIRSIIVMIFVLSIGKILDVGFDQIWVLRNPIVADITEVISTYTYSFGLRGGYMSLASAIGLFESVVGMLMVLLANRLAKLFNEEIW